MVADVIVPRFMPWNIASLAVSLMPRSSALTITFIGIGSAPLRARLAFVRTTGGLPYSVRKVQADLGLKTSEREDTVRTARTKLLALIIVVSATHLREHKYLKVR